MEDESLIRSTTHSIWTGRCGMHCCYGKELSSAANEAISPTTFNRVNKLPDGTVCVSFGADSPEENPLLRPFLGFRCVVASSSLIHGYQMHPFDCVEFWQRRTFCSTTSWANEVPIAPIAPSFLKFRGHGRGYGQRILLRYLLSLLCFSAISDKRYHESCRPFHCW